MTGWLPNRSHSRRPSKQLSKPPESAEAETTRGRRRPVSEHEVAIELSANDHAAYAIGGAPIRATTSFVVPSPTPVHHHPSPLEVDGEVAIPAVSLQVSRDAASGWNLAAKVSGFRLAPENVSTPHVAGEGHLHLYIDGNKITRLYDEWYHIPSLPVGTHTIRVELSANNHSLLTHNGNVIDDTVQLEVTAGHTTS